MLELLSLAIVHDQDVVLARKRARQVAEALGFDGQSQTRIATVVSEVVRNAHRYAGGGRLRFGVEDRAGRQLLRIDVSDDGPGIPHLEDVLAGRYRSTTGMGMGLVGTRRLADEFDVRTAPGRGTTVVVGKWIPPGVRPFTAPAAAAFTAELARERTGDPFAEVQQQNQELLRTLAELRERQEEVDRLNRALQERGADLATQVQVAERSREVADEASRAKSGFLAMMSHELRTPLGAILGYARLIGLGIAGPVTAEQQRYLDRIARAQAHLLGLIDDVLAFAKLESGKLPLELGAVAVRDVCATVETLTEPQLAEKRIRYRCANVDPSLLVVADADKVLQILINLVTNAMKFTPADGEIALSAEADGDVVRMTVTDTGRGVPADKLEAIFEPFVQVERRLRGTSEGVGLGLSISRELARAMGGDLRVRSTFGAGAAFMLTLPRDHAGQQRSAATRAT